MLRSDSMGILIIDFSQVTISAIQATMSGKNTGIKVFNKDICRHIILNSLRSIVFKFKQDYKEVIIACDSRKYWRKDVFPFYKYKRAKNREKSLLDWNLIFEVMDEVKLNIKEFFPYKLLEIEKAEADDIIGTLTARLSKHQHVVIVSSDGDFLQLQKYPNVKQYNPKLKIFITSTNPVEELKEKIIKGDVNDGIPSCISDDNVFAAGIRQKPLTKKLKDSILNSNFNDETNQYYRQIQRNKLLIDLSMIPQDIKDNIVEEYEISQSGSKNEIMKYFIKHKLTLLLEVLDEF